MLPQSTYPCAQLAALTTAKLYNLLQPITVSSRSPRASFTNWGRTFTCTPLAIFEPETDDQCALVLELARREGRRVRFAGIGHSPSDLACTSEYMLRTIKLNKVLEVDTEKTIVVAQGGIILNELNECLAAHGLAMSNIGSISDQTLAGVITTATHGTGVTFGVMSTMVLELTLMLADGSKVTCSEQERPDLFKASLCGLGATGLILAVKLQVEPAFRLKEEQNTIEFDAFINEFDDLMCAAEHVRFWWFIQNGLSEILFFYEAGLKIDTVDKYPQYTTEWAVPLENAQQCLLELRTWVENEYADPNGIRPHFPIEIRFTEADDIWLSPGFALPFIANFTAGAIAGITEILTFYPLDVVKTRMQLERGKTSHGLVGSFKTIIAEEGFGRLYRGLVPPLLLEAPKRATKFAANDFWGKTFMGWTGEAKMTQSLSVLTGCSAGATESFVVVPFELVKIKLQDKNSVFAGPMDVVRQIVKSEGALGLYAGMEATFWRFDVVKSRIQGAEKVAGSVPKYNWTYPALATILREEGPAALYKGFVPKVLRLAPGGGVLLLVVEFTLGIFRKALGPPYI
ncbi:hypothetical protein EW145_g3801 [Phellinidium pouzarii]|uniref:D-arabinono-1,4-lactone oxidase n=1 Tax=Phellinidium pouzarii TaxID=167371 RepID=A0A4V3XCQ9_9AGAM|nr:hypothetical protein EW145_g3801 [Phellinidium pouzarii]